MSTHLLNDLEFLDDCMEIQNMKFKTSKMNQIASQGRWKRISSPKATLKNGSLDQKSKHRKCAEACHSPINFCSSSNFFL